MAESVPERVEALRQEGNDCLVLEEYKQAYNNYSKAVELIKLDKSLGVDNELHATLLCGMAASCRFNSNEECSESALQLCNQAVDLSPEFYKVWLRRAQLHEDMKLYAAAEQDYLRAAKLNSSLQAAAQSAERCRRALADRVGSKELQEFDDFNPPQSIVALKCEADEKFVEGEYESAYMLYNQALEDIAEQGLRSKFCAALLCGIAATCRYTDRIKQGLECAKQATKNVPHYHKSWLRLAQINEDLANYAAADEGYTRALELEPKLKAAAAGKQRCRQKLKPEELDGEIVTPGAQRNMPKKLSKFDEHRNRGNDLFQQGDYKAALAAYSVCVEDRPHETKALTNRALCKIKLGQFHEAIEDCSAALAEDPKCRKALYRRGLCYKELGDFRLAMKDLKLLLSYDSNNSYAKDELDLVRAKWKEELLEFRRKITSPNPERSVVDLSSQASENGHTSDAAMT